MAAPYDRHWSRSGSRENGQVVHLPVPGRQSFNLTDGQSRPQRTQRERHAHHAKLGKSRPHLPNTEFASLKVDVIALKLDVHQIIEQFITRNIQTWTQTHHTIWAYSLRRTQTIDTKRQKPQRSHR